MVAVKAALSLLVKVLGSMIQSLMTEKFMKWAVIRLAKSIVAKTETKEDDAVLAKILEEWK